MKIVQYVSNKVTLTPGTQARLQHESGYGGIEDFDKHQVHVDGFHQHPGHRGQEEVVEEEADDDAARGRISTIDADDEDKVQTEKGEREVDQDLLRLLRSEFP